MGEPIPVRMLNEHLYCPRLFHLMHVQEQWDESAETIEGRSQHERASSRAPVKPKETEEGEIWPALPQTLHLGDEALGITGKLDALEQAGSSTEGTSTWVPVEAKHAAPPSMDRPALAGEIELSSGAWANDQIQLCAQGLLLRSHGYSSTHGYLYYRKTKQRVRIDFDEKLVRATRLEIEKARLTCKGEMPPPLVDSPKCPKCSLLNICVPEETNFLLGKQDKPPARVTPGRDDLGVLYLSEPGSYLGKRSESLVISPPKGSEEPEVRIPFKDVAHITLAGAVQVSTQLIQEALIKGRSLTWLSAGGRFLGGAHPPLVKNFHLRREQFRLLDDKEKRLRLSRSVVLAKILNCRTILRRNGPKDSPSLIELRQMVTEARRVSTIDELMGVEGNAARIYFSAFANLLKGDDTFDWKGRNRRPPRDPINALLSLSYALLLRDMETAIRNAGLEPMAGFFHVPEDGRPSLALDLMEPFRPLIADSAVLRMVNSKILEKNDFFILPGQASLKQPARKKFFAAYEGRMNDTIRHPQFTYSISYRRTLELEARLFARHLEGEIDDYIPLMTR